ncbi:uncharacterized protein LOC120908513 [Anopheles arabiensis]|uniref:Uncharacterized protein n=1 Tax=Anopheles arabiensis TaxID=7173 RepID=A0A182HL38_ANOAR|nr:uncharacterized protein LOC120908513 [Anopheles arabiensis]
MAQQKFFSGLTEGMIKRAAGERPDRQKTQFYWPDEDAPDSAAPTDTAPSLNGRPHQLSRRSSTASSGSTAVDSPATLHYRRRQSIGEPIERDRHPKHAGSNIQFYDGVGSSFAELERTRAHERHRIEQFLRQQSEEETGGEARAKRLSTLQSNIAFYDDCTSVALPVVNGSGGDRRTHTEGWERADKQDVSELSELDDFDDRSSYRSGSVCSSTTSGYRRSTSVMPEHKRNSQRHLRSSINFHNGCATADDREDTRKPVTVRESATARVVVGLPNL